MAAVPDEIGLRRSQGQQPAAEGEASRTAAGTSAGHWALPLPEKNAGAPLDMDDERIAATSGPPHIARHVIGRHSTQKTRVQNACR